MNLPAMAYLVNAADNHASNKKDRLVILCVQYARTSTQVVYFRSAYLKNKRKSFILMSRHP